MSDQIDITSSCPATQTPTQHYYLTLPLDTLQKYALQVAVKNIPSVPATDINAYLSGEDIHLENFPESNISTVVSNDESCVSIVAHLLQELTDIDPIDIGDILKREVPDEVNRACAEVENLFCDKVLKDAREKSSDVDSHTPSHVGTSFDESFMRVLLGEVTSHYESANTKNSTVSRIESKLLDVLMISLGPSIRHESKSYHRKWTLFIKEFLDVVSRGGIGTRRADVKDQGETNFGFIAEQEGTGSAPYYKKFHAKPDSAVVMHEKIGHVNLLYPVLVADIKTTYAETDDYVPRQKKANSSSGSSFLSSDPQTPNSPAKRHRMQTCHDSGSSSMEFSDATGSNPRTSTYTSSKEPSVQTKIVKAKAKSSKCTSSVAEEGDMHFLKYQHLVQLIGMLKWANCVVQDAAQVSMTGLGVDLRKKLRSYGLFSLENRVYLTSLSVEPLSSDRASLCEKKVRYWGRNVVLNYRDIKEFEENTSTRYKTADVCLDIFQPEHLKALLLYTRVVVWRGSKILQIPLAQQQNT